MFEFSVALKYLIPRKKQLSVSLIALLSVVVISLIVWLVLVFLSVTEGIERGWLHKLTTLNAPLRITPTPHYYASYYYQIDAFSGRSQYTLKNIAAKAQTSLSDPYDPLEDGELPLSVPQRDLKPDHSLKDPVKELFTILTKMKENRSDLVFQDFEISGALMRLQLLRPATGISREEHQGYLTQVSYLASVPNRCPDFTSLLLPPSEKDLNHLLYLATHSTELSRQDTPALTAKTTTEIAKSRVKQILKRVKIRTLKPTGTFWQMPLTLLPEHKPLMGIAKMSHGKLNRIDIPINILRDSENYVKVWKEGNQLFMEEQKGIKRPLSKQIPLLIDGPIHFNVIDTSPETFPLSFIVTGAVQHVRLQGEVSLQGLEISKADFLENDSMTPWVLNPLGSETALVINEEKETGVLLPKNFLDHGVLIGDRGYLSYSSTTSSALQEHRLPIFVSGFYDPGVFSIGNKCILVPSFVIQTINASSSSFNLDKTQSNGILVWFKNLQEAKEIKNELLQALTAKGIESYWKITTFQEYDFAKDLLQQFQSDKTLFTLVAVIILIVACCNIISLLVLLVNDKRREIGILQAMGASRLNIAFIFGICGISLGFLSSVLGIGAALITLRHIDALVQFLSMIQGHEAFHATFFGKSLPNQLSHHAVLFILITTPLLSLFAGLVPAIKACCLRPSAILRSE